MNSTAAASSPLNEQTVYKVPGNTHTSRHAAVELLYCEQTGDCGRKKTRSGG